jgi:hypothetical protein
VSYRNRPLHLFSCSGLTLYAFLFSCLALIFSREDLIAKTLTDISSFDRPTAEAEVDKFLMDYDMVNLYIQYEKELEKNPNFVVPADREKDDGLFSFRNIVAAYIAYLAATTVPNAFRGYVAKQELAGQWKPTNIQFLDEWIERTSPEATARILQKAAKAASELAQQAATDVSQAASDAAVQSADTLQTAVDAVQTGLQ